MKKTFIKLVSILTAIMIVSGALAGINFSTVTAVESTLFSDGFDYASTSEMTAAGWNNGAYSFLNNNAVDFDFSAAQKLSLEGNSALKALTDYSVEADFKITRNSGTTSTGYFGLMGRMTDGKGYEFVVMAGSTTNGKLSARIRKLASSNTPLVSTSNVVNFTSGNTYKLKMVFEGATIKGYINGNLVCTATDSDFASGAPGLNWAAKANSSVDVTMDNLAVKAELPDTIDMPFTGSYTGSALGALGYATSGEGIDTVAGYIANGKLTYATATSGVGFYTRAVSEDSYTVSVDMTVESISGSAAYSVLVGAPDAKYASCYSCELGTNSSKITYLRVRTIKANGTADTVTYPLAKIDITPNSNRIDVGAAANIKIDVVYNTATSKTTVTISVTSGGTERVGGSFIVDGKLHGRVGLYKTHSNGSVSFDNLRVSAYEEPLDPNTYFIDKFEDNKSMTDNGWSHVSGTKANGVFTLDSGKFSYTSGAKDADTWGDYAVTAKVKTGMTAVPTDDSSNIASIVARSANTANGGYEFRIGVNKDGTYYQLYKRANPSVAGKINGSDHKFTKTIDLSVAHNLKIIVMGARVLCYNGEELIFDVTDTYADGNTYSAGYAGIRAPSGTADYDDFTVRKITDQEKQDIAALTPPAPPPEEDDDEELGENMLFADDFEGTKAMNKKGWNASNDTGVKADGAFTINVGTATYLTGVTDSDKWDDYVVEADIRYNSAVVADDAVSVTNIVARSAKTTSSGYEFGFRCNADGTTQLRLYKRLAKDSTLKKMEHLLPYTVLPDTYYHAKMVVLGDRIICYFNGIKVFDVIDSEAYMEGYTGIRNAGSGYTSTYDNYVVRKILTTDIVDDKRIEKLGGDIWFKDSFDGETSLTERGWSGDEAEFVNGAVSLVKTTNSMYINGVKGSEKWTDYTVTATVEIDKSQGLFADQTMGATWIVARSNKTKSSGYEFGIMSYQSGKYNLRLYDRTDATDLMVLDGYNITDGAHELKMICQANVIRCYFDGELVITVTDDTNKAGYAGLRASGYVANYDNFTVSAIKGEQKLDIVSPEQNTVTSPVTGVAAVACTVVAPISFALSAIALIMIVVSRNAQKRSDKPL